jgi:hypothetical protein
LFRFASPRHDALLAVWSLEREADQLLRYVKERFAEPARDQPGEEGTPSLAATLGNVSSLVTGGAMADLLHRQRGAMVQPGSGRPGLTLRPIYQEVTFAIPAMVARASAAVALAAQPGPAANQTTAATIDPYVFQYIAGRLDERLLAALTDEIAADGPLDARAGDGAPNALHVNLTLAATSSAAFGAFADRCASRQLPIGVEVAFAEAAADPARFAAFKREAQARAVAVLLDSVPLLSLAIVEPCLDGIDFLKLDWPSLVDGANLPETERIDAAIRRLDPSRLVLQRAETEAALHWGMARGIRHFQGRHVDAMLGANRMMNCRHAAACTIRQCVDRAAALAPAGRAGCTNTAALDAWIEYGNMLAAA